MLATLNFVCLVCLSSPTVPPTVRSLRFVLMLSLIFLKLRKQIDGRQVIISKLKRDNKKVEKILKDENVCREVCVEERKLKELSVRKYLEKWKISASLTFHSYTQREGERERGSSFDHSFAAENFPQMSFTIYIN